MSLPLKTQSDLYDLAITAIQDQDNSLTDTLEGSDIDIIAGVIALVANEVQRQTLIQFNKTFIDLANGPEITGGPDDLQTLAVDHFGEDFARPGAVKAIDTAIFTRPDNSAGQITIGSGTVVRTTPDEGGNSQRYTTNADVIMTANSSPSDTSVTVAITAVIAGSNGNAGAGSINSIETTLLDATIVVTNVGNATGLDAENDSLYRETIRNLIAALAGATLQAIQSAALTVPGVETATPVEEALTVIQYNPVTHATVGQYFYIPKATLYVADATGTASPALINAVKARIKTVKACGTFLNVAAASAQIISWTSSITLNPSGPNYSTLVNDTTMIIDAMTAYINNLPTGSNFIRSTANAAILSIFGPAGTNDLTALTTSIPSGDVTGTGTTKFVAGTVATI